MMAEYKFKDSFEFVPYSRLVFSANHPPKSQEASPAFFRRWIVVPFDRTFADGDPDTIPGDKLDAILSDPVELSGVLNKALEALAAMIQSLDLCSALAQVISEHRDHLGVPQNLYLPVTATWAGDDSQDRASGNGDRRTVDVGAEARGFTACKVCHPPE